jgi:hypothetical protein
MLLSLRDAFTALLRDAYPTVFGGADPPVEAGFQAEEWTWDPSSADATAGQPAQDDARDVLAFDPDDAEGPYALSRPPYPGPRRVYLRTPDGDRLVLGAEEVRWDPADARAFTLHPRPVRVLAGYEAVEVLYGVTAVFTRLKSVHQVTVALAGDDEAALERGEVLALAAFALNREAVMKSAAFSEAGGDYQAHGEVKSLVLRRGAAAAGLRTLVLDAEVELKVSRALADDEGRPIERIITPGAAAGARRVDVRIDVEA